MVGVVVVSHSAKIAEGICELAKQMAAPKQKIVAAGGMADGNIGTDAVRIQQAIEEGDSGDGVVILVDLGSAIISTELAIDMLEESCRQRVAIADAPILEGAIAASVEASLGEPLSKVLASAKQASELHKC